MNSKFVIRQTFLLILMSILFGAASFIELGSRDYPINPIFLKLRYGLVSLCFLTLLLFSLFERKSWYKCKFNRETTPLLWLWILFCVLVEVSAWFNNDLVSMRDGYWLMIAVPIIFFYILPRLLKNSANIIIPGALVLSHIPYIIISFWLVPPLTSDFTFYRGVLGNSNQLGFISVVSAAGILILLSNAFLYKKSVIKILLLLSLLCVSIFTIYIAFARTSMLTLLLMIIICCWVVFSRHSKSMFKIAFFAAFIVSILLFEVDKIAPFIEYDLGINIADILQKKDFSLTGRELIWIKTLNESTFFGHGSNYYDSFGQGPHNTVIKTLGMYGFVAAYAIIFVAIASLWHTYAYFKACFKKNHYAISPFIITVCFWTLSLGEDMFGSLGKGISLAFFASLGVVMTRCSSEEPSGHIKNLA